MGRVCHRLPQAKDMFDEEKTSDDGQMQQRNQKVQDVLLRCSEEEKAGPVKLNRGGMRKASLTAISNGDGPSEPLIVVEESEGIAEEEEDEEEESKPSPPETSSINQYLLTPWRDTRKRSLPTPPCTSGITASQVRRLSERGGEGSGPSPIEQAFLATLSQAPTPMPGTRRHSVVTISKAPPLPPLFGRSRRESIAAFASGMPGLPLRRDSIASQPRGSLSGVGNSGSSFNLHLDIMDDITEAKARAKERRKLSRTHSKELMDENDSACSSSEKHPLQNKKPDSETSAKPWPKKTGPGIVCSNSDLISILSPLTSSAQEICGTTEREKDTPTIITNPNTGSPTQQKTILERKRKQFQDRSNSFDVGSLPGGSSGPASWFVKRHQPIAKKDEVNRKSNIIVTFTDEKQKTQTSVVGKSERSKSLKGVSDSTKAASPTGDKNNQVVWDNRSGSLVDPQVLGSAIEIFLNQKTTQEKEPPSPPVNKSPVQAKDSPTKSTAGISKSWLGSSNQEAVSESSSDTCDTSICSTLKDLFVK